MRLRLGYAPDPDRGDPDAPRRAPQPSTDPVAGFKGAAGREREGKGRKGDSRDGKGRGGKLEQVRRLAKAGPGPFCCASARQFFHCSFLLAVAA